MNAYIQMEGVHNVIDGNSVLQRIDLQLEQRLIYGFRAISGLIHPSEGTIMVDGKQIRKDLSFPENLGLLIEHPGFIPEYTGLKNLDLLALIQGKIGKQQVKDAINRVGLDPNDRRKFRKYSLGMKQRLGIAQAIMEDPELIILDEPTNGLDEDGVKWINQMILDLKEEGKTILIASHDRESLDKVSDEIYQIDGGKIIKHEVVSEVPIK